MAAGVILLYRWLEPPQRDNGISRKDIVETLNRLGRLSTNPAPVYVPIDLKRPIRLAIGTLGFDHNEQNGEIQDLVLARLTGAPGLELVERQSVESILHELNLSMSGLVRAKDAVRVGKLLKADWFLLGTGAKIAGTNSLVLRIVDARTGIMRDAGVFSSERPTTEIAADITAFVRESRKSAASSQPHLFLAIGAFEDLSVTKRQAAFPGQLRAYLVAAYWGTNVTLLEREAVDTLFQEARLDLAGLTEGSETNSPQRMQSAYWLVDGAYQSYEATNIEMIAEVTRIFGGRRRFSFRGKPDQVLFGQVKNAIDWQMKTNAGFWPTRVSEARAQLVKGKELANLDPLAPWIDGEWDEAEVAMRRYNAEEAIRAFETVILLEPTNWEAKLYLAGCLRIQNFSNLEKARDYYREIIREPRAEKGAWMAKLALDDSFRWSNPDEKVRWFRSVSERETNSLGFEFYCQKAEAAEEEVILSENGPKARALAEKQLPERMRSAFGGPNMSDLGTRQFLKAYGTNRSAAAQRLVELYPTLRTTLSNAVPYLLAAIVVTQEDTNAPIVGEFQRLLEAYTEFPDEVAKSEAFWSHVWSPVYDWSFNHKLYRMAASVIEAETRATEFDTNHFFSVGEEQKMKLAFAYVELREWRKALDIFEAYTNPLIEMPAGPWGATSLIFPNKQSAYCRQMLGLSTPTNPLEFDMGKPALCMCSPSCFIADEKGLWVGIQGQILRMSFDLKTNLVVRLPMSPSTPITALSLHSSNLWVGTAGEGLIQCEKGGHLCRRFTLDDGLAMDSISDIQASGDVLWIGYTKGIGSLDLSTHKFTFFTPSIEENLIINDGPPKGPIQAIAAGQPGEVWFAADHSRVGRYRATQDSWVGIRASGFIRSLAADEDRLYVGQSWSHNSGTAKGPIGVAFVRTENLQSQDMGPVEGLPSLTVSTLTLDGDNLWVGGTGYIAMVDTKSSKVRKYAHVLAKKVDRIQIGGGYLWAQFDWHLYRAPLSGL